MKKTIAISLIIAFCLTGCTFGKKKTEDANKMTEDMTLLGQLKNSEGIVCTVATLNGEVNVKAKGNNVRIEGIPYVYDQSTSSDTIAPQNNLGTMLAVGDEQYIWSDTKGTKFNPKELSEMTGGQTEEQMEAKDWQATVGEWQQAGFTYKCEKQSLPDDIFTPPTDINFIDLNETLRFLQNLNQQTPSEINAGSTTSDIVSDPTGSMPSVNASAPTEGENVESE